MNALPSSMDTIDKLLDRLPAADKTLFQRFYTLRIQRGQLRVPSHMHDWVQRQFGSLKIVSEQQIVRLSNKLSGEETIFNNIRHLRPSDTRENIRFSIDSIDMGTDNFANPKQTTPEDPFGRINGKYCITASNIAKFNELHGLVIFNKSNPLRFTREEVLDYVDTGWRWAEQAHKYSPANKYFFFCWNCLWRSGASINHGHAQMALSRGKAYARIESLRKTALSYRQRYDCDYFDDLFRIHQALGLAYELGGVRVMAYLTPIKNNEIVLMSPKLTPAFAGCLYDGLSLYRDALGSMSFNFALTAPPLSSTRETWQGFPVIGWLVERGKLESRSSDVGSLELFAANFVDCNPFKLAELMAKQHEKSLRV
ncbi:MAG: hypothetical protein FWE97_00310 [Dehalococcoidia bacterium]|nr:hypothetical protein [Dehalococcoidia bacterium]